MAKALSPGAYSTVGVTMRVRKSPPFDNQMPSLSVAAFVGSPMDAPGLPPLPKSLDTLLNANSGSWRETLRNQAQKSAAGAGSLSPEESLSSSSSSSTPTTSKGKRKARRVSIPRGNLDGALAVLRKEMVGLRQLDMSLLSQLWSLHESIQEYKIVVESMSCLSDRDSMDLDSEDMQSLSSLSPGLLSPSSVV